MPFQILKPSVVVLMVISTWLYQTDPFQKKTISLNLMKKPSLQLTVVGKYTDPFKEENTREFFHAVHSEQYTGTYQVSIETVF